jgi:glycosyltransferase involved in cell wall biosynthesis
MMTLDFSPNRKMRVLNVCVCLDPVTGGGVVERTFQMSRFLVRSGVECAILSTDLGLTAKRKEALKEIELIIFPCFNKRFYIPKISYRRVRDAVKDADIIHLSDCWSVQNILIYCLARFLCKPYVMCAAGSLGVSGRSRLLKRIYNGVIGKKIIRGAAACIAITKDEIPLFRACGAEGQRIFVIPNGINRDGLTARNDEEFRSKFALGNHHIILFVGRLSRIKGPDLLLRAFCNLKEILHDYQLVFVGPDEGMLPELESIVTKNNINERVHFLGYLGGEAKSFAYNAAELLVIPSRKEAMSIVVLESGAVRTPVLITDQCGFEEVAGVNGGKVVPATVEGLQNGLLEMLTNMDDLKVMGLNLQKHVIEQFMWESIVHKYISLYRSILDGESLQDADTL